MRRVRGVELAAAALLIAVGLILLLINANVLPGLPSVPLVWAILLLGGGLAFVAGFLVERAHWWALIVGFSL
ncbi:MAG: hypothetical protein QME94_14005, partial [Anaerolineae bacterium]|nr:hypothetical protein [Anaerolineae bacterium]